MKEIEKLNTAPTKPKKGQLYINKTTQKTMVYNGNEWAEWEPKIGKEMFDFARANAYFSDEAREYYSMLFYGLTYMGAEKLFELLEQSATTGRKIVYDEANTTLITITPKGLKLE